MAKADTEKAKLFYKRLRQLSSDGRGSQSYRNYADTVLNDISELPHVATLTLQSKEPLVASIRLINHPRSAPLAKMILDENGFKCLIDLVTISYEAKQLALTPKSQVKNEDIKGFKYLEKLYSKGVEKLQKEFGYGTTKKKRFKDRFEELRSFVGDEFSMRRWDLENEPFDDDDDEEDLFDLELDEESKPKKKKKKKDKKSDVSDMVAQLEELGYTITAPKNANDEKLDALIYAVNQLIAMNGQTPIQVPRKQMQNAPFSIEIGEDDEEEEDDEDEDDISGEPLGFSEQLDILRHQQMPLYNQAQRQRRRFKTEGIKMTFTSGDDEPDVVAEDEVETPVVVETVAEEPPKKEPTAGELFNGSASADNSQ